MRGGGADDESAGAPRKPPLGSRHSVGGRLQPQVATPDHHLLLRPPPWTSSSSARMARTWSTTSARTSPVSKCKIGEIYWLYFWLKCFFNTTGGAGFF